MRHAVIFWLLLAVSFISTSFPNQKQNAAEKALNETQAKIRAFLDMEVYIRKLAEQVLKGRQLSVRIYDDSDRDFRAFKLVPVELMGLGFSYTQVASAYGQIPEPAVLVIIASDQKDEAVAAVIGDFMFAEPYKSTGGISIWPVADYTRRYDRLTFNDALGNPMPNAAVELLVGAGTDKYPQISISLGKLDEKGQLKRPQLVTWPTTRVFVVSHPDYGTALTTSGDRDHRSVDIYTVPIVPIGTQADERTIRGVVLDSENNPIKDATIECHGLRTSSGGRMSANPYARPETTSDANGRFAMYLPINQDANSQGTLVPLRAEYFVTVKAPKGLGLESHTNHIRSGEETTITLRRTTPISDPNGYFHCFLFEDEAGPIVDPNRLKTAVVRVTSPKGDRILFYENFKNGEKLPLGTYSATMQQPNRQMFGPIEVTEDSPELLIFELDRMTGYKGQVVDGITGRPMSGAFVAAGLDTHITTDFSVITSEQWQALHALPLEPSLDDPNLAPVLKVITEAKGVVRTDESGRFDMELPAGSGLQSIFAFEQDYLCAERLESRLQGDPASLQSLTMKLFPSATIIIEPNVPGEVDDSWLRFRYWGDHDIDPVWLASRVAGARQGQIFATATQQLRPSGVQSVHIPAGLKLDIAFYFRGDSKWCPIVLHDTKLKQGQALDLGRQDFQPAIRVLVKLVNSADQPVAGVAVHHYAEGYPPWINPPITNEQGVASLYIPANSSGEFIVQYLHEKTGASYCERTPYEVAGEEDRDRMFTFQLSDRMLSDLFK